MEIGRLRAVAHTAEHHTLERRVRVLLYRVHG